MNQEKKTLEDDMSIVEYEHSQESPVGPSGLLYGDCRGSDEIRAVQKEHLCGCQLELSSQNSEGFVWVNLADRKRFIEYSLPSEDLQIVLGVGFMRATYKKQTLFEFNSAEKTFAPCNVNTGDEDLQNILEHLHNEEFKANLLKLFEDATGRISKDLIRYIRTTREDKRQHVAENELYIPSRTLVDIAEEILYARIPVEESFEDHM